MSSDPLVNPLARILGDVVVQVLRRPDVIEAIRAVAAPSAPVEPVERLLSKKGIATALGVSQSTIDRLVREGMPVAVFAGESKRFELDACRQWLSQRGRRPTTAATNGTHREIDVSDVIARAGLVRQ
ncbi:MAG TPA: hypothetical protein VEK07_14790 [Polyangiaceae bacterium]|nr:hypothetical protein [Polyangiaceae bacterium]